MWRRVCDARDVNEAEHTQLGHAVQDRDRRGVDGGVGHVQPLELRVGGK